MAPQAAHAGQKMIVVGGGTRPEAANSKFVEWSGGSSARILVLSWPAPDPIGYYDHLANDLQAYKPKSILHGVQAGDVATKRADLVDQIADATGIFFTGGDQTPAMEILDADARVASGPTILQLLQDAYARGVVFGGTSAGTAMMSTPMLTGEGDESILDGKQIGTRDGLGLIPGVVFDQHFMARHRMLRLMGVMQLHPAKIGFGIDESTALLIEDSRYAEVVGDSKVLVMEVTSKDGAVKVDPLTPGTRYDMAARKRTLTSSQTVMAQ